jgi:hypothetical protein
MKTLKNDGAILRINNTKHESDLSSSQLYKAGNKHFKRLIDFQYHFFIMITCEFPKLDDPLKLWVP